MKIIRLLTYTGGLFSLLGTAAMAAVPVDGDITFQPSATPVMDKLTWFHNVLVLPTMIAIVLFVMVLMIYIVFRFNEKANPVPSKTSHNTLIEVIWTVVPVVILLVLGVFGMNLLYFESTVPEYDMSVKVTGNTWNWEYAYPEYPEIDSFVSNMLEKEDALAEGRPYLLAADQPLVVPVDTTVKVLVTSNNNLHSFAMPAFGMKMDAIPGRINETWFKVHPGMEGTYYGQCSEICGVRHAFMPIEIQVVSKDAFKTWVANGGAFTDQLAENTGGSVTTTAVQE